MDRWPDDDPAPGAPGPGADDEARRPLGFEDLYAPEILSAIDARARSRQAPVAKVSQWRRTSALGAVLTGMALGLQEVFDPEDERSIVVEVDDEGMPADLPVQMILDPDSPAGSLCIVHRPGTKPPMV